MSIEDEKNLILQPNSWEAIVARESQRPLEELTSTQPLNLQQQIARSFLKGLVNKPTKYGVEEFSRCLSVHTSRKQQWQKHLEELREDDEDLLDDLEKQEASLAVQTNSQLATLNFFQDKVDYYTQLLPFAQKSADDTAFLWDKIPVNLPPKSQRKSFAKLLHKHGVVYTPQTIVDTIHKLIRYYRLQHTLYMSVKKGENCSLSG